MKNVRWYHFSDCLSRQSDWTTDAGGMDARTDSEISLLHSGRSLRIKILTGLDRIKSGTGAASAVSVFYIRRR